MYLPGVDTHAGYGPIDADKLKAFGIRHLWAKCTEGDQGGGKYVDQQFARTVAECKRVGIPVGAYHFCFPLSGGTVDRGANAVGDTPEEQLEYFWANSKGLGSQPGELSPAIDAEWPAPQDASKWGITRASINEWLKRFCELVAERWGRNPLIYTYPAWWKWLSEGADTSWASEYLVWWADYDHPGPGVPTGTPSHWHWQKTWENWAGWQYSADGSPTKVPGLNSVPVDRGCIRNERILDVLMGVDILPPDFPIVHPAVPVE